MRVGVCMWRGSVCTIVSYSYKSFAILTFIFYTYTHTHPGLKTHDGHPLIVLCTALAAIAGVLSGAWMTFMIKRAADIIK